MVEVLNVSTGIYPRGKLFKGYSTTLFIYKIFTDKSTEKTELDVYCVIHTFIIVYHPAGGSSIVGGRVMAIACATSGRIFWAANDRVTIHLRF